MCGFVGIVSIEKVTNKEFYFAKKGLDMIKNRGPNNQNIIKGENFILGHNRLKIIDYSDKSNQPLISNNGKNILIFNGEIYNYKSLRKNLEKEYEFKSKGDGEVLLAGLSIYGRDFLSECNGMYSFAFLTRDKDQVKSILISRDSFGQKPLFYSISKKSICFSSTIESLPIDYSKFNFDKYSISKYFHYGYVPAPLTIIEGVYCALPGYIYEFNLRNNSFQELPPYLIPKFTPPINYKSYEDLFNDSLEQSLESDSSISVAFSSGRDSVQIACGLAALGRKDITLLNVSSYDPKLSETLHAKKIASQLGLPFYSISPSEIDIFDEIENLYMPFADSSYLMSKILFKNAKRFSSVIMMGDGGDELHYSYPHYKKINNDAFVKLKDYFLHNISNIFDNNLLSNLPYRYKKFFSYFSLAKSDPLRIVRSSFFSPYDFKRNCLVEHPDFGAENFISNLVNSYKDHNDIIKARQNWDKYFIFPNCLSVKTDLASMHYSLEARSPYLNNLFQEGLNNLFSPKELSSRPKYLQNKYISRFIDKNLMTLKKQGFEFGLKRKMKEIDIDYFLSRTTQTPWLRENTIFDLLESVRRNESTQEMLYSVIVISSVYRNFSKLGVSD